MTYEQAHEAVDAMTRWLGTAIDLIPNSAAKGTANQLNDALNSAGHNAINNVQQLYERLQRDEKASGLTMVDREGRRMPLFLCRSASDWAMVSNVLSKTNILQH